MGRGRPPIGKRAMTPAEKQRRYRERHGLTGAAQEKPAKTKTDAAMAKELAQAKARIAELEQELARAKAAAARRRRRRRRGHGFGQARPQSCGLKAHRIGGRATT